MSANPATVWTTEEIAELTRLHAQREPALSYTEIGAKIGRKRNACIGKAHRLKLPDRSDMRSHGRPRAEPSTLGIKRRRGPVSPTRIIDVKRRAGEPRKSVAAARSEPQPVRTVLLNGSDGCRWPAGDHPFVFCGGTVERGQVYCGEHCRLAYRPKIVSRSGRAA
jgi:hypothetical protein